MEIGEAAKLLGVCPCVVPRLVKLGRISASTTSEGQLDIDSKSVNRYKSQKRGRKYTRW